jgi:hypothetical protein
MAYIWCNLQQQSGATYRRTVVRPIGRYWCNLQQKVVSLTTESSATYGGQWCD